ncbi:1411_t:CDS:2, partial [Gigaspora margarita]
MGHPLSKLKKRSRHKSRFNRNTGSTISVSSRSSANESDGIISPKDSLFRFYENRRFYGDSICMPNDDEECDRLHLQHFLYKHVWHGNFFSPIEKILNNSTDEKTVHVLDVGCAAASWVFDMATTFPSANFTGVDISPHQPFQIKPFNVTFVTANVMDGLPFQNNSFDFIHQRLLFSSYKTSQWNFVINELVRILKPGGYLELVELDPMVKDVGPATLRVFEAACQLLINYDTDRYTCYKLKKYLMEQGQLENISYEERQLRYGNNYGRLGQVAVEHHLALMQSLKPELLKIICIPSDEYDELIKNAENELFELNSYSVIT